MTTECRNQIGAAVLGLGNMGETHARAALDSPFISHAMGYEPSAERAALRGKKIGIETSTNLDAIMDDPAIKLVFIASPNPTHADLAIQAMKAGKAVLCEKPISETLETARKVVAVQEKTGQFLQLGFELRYSKMYTQAKQWIDQGLIGDPVNGHCRYYCSEFHLKDSWRSNSPGSLIGEKLSHYLDGLRWYMGSSVVEVFSMTAPNAVDYFNHPDNHQISLRFANGAIANLNFVMHLAETDAADPLLEVMEKQADDGHSLQYHLFGTQGAIETDVFKRRVRRWKFSDSPKQMVSEIDETVTFPKEEDQKWFHNVYGQDLRIAELVAEGRPPENPVSDSFESMKVCFAAEISEREKRVVSLAELD